LRTNVLAFSLCNKISSTRFCESTLCIQAIELFVGKY
jgi:hypothetical protein